MTNTIEGCNMDLSKVEELRRAVEVLRMKICPCCKKEYLPKLERKTGKCIQDEYPNATAEEREQLISGLCSTKCWNKFLGLV